MSKGKITPTEMRPYAKLIAKTGANIQNGQDVIISAELDQPEFICVLVEECYKLGARRVDVRWHHQPLERIHAIRGKIRALSETREWELKRLEEYTETLPVMIYIDSEDPSGLSSLGDKNKEKYFKAAAARRAAAKPYRDKMESKYQWCIAAVPGAKWARKLFPHTTTDNAVNRLWDMILKTARADVNPMKQWDAHNKDLKKRCEFLNSLNIKKLHYRSKNGTSLTVGIPEGARFAGGSEFTLGGVEFNPNIPSEEVFTSPKFDEVDGKLVSSMPLSYQGQLIENFWFVFEHGKVVEYHAEKNEDLLGNILKTDEGSSYLGECALVPYDSPIRNTETLFYNTLFDENASCHFALGDSYPETLTGFENMTKEQLKEHGLNSSLIHVDFMVGTDDLDITAITADGRKAPIFRHGNWAEN